MSNTSGGLIISGLLRTAAWLMLFAVIAFDIGGLLTNRILLDEAARVAATQAAAAVLQAEPTAARGGAISTSAAAIGEQAARESLADQPGIELRSFAVTGGQVVLTAHRRARSIVAHRLPPLRGAVDPVVTATVSLARER